MSQNKETFIKIGYDSAFAIVERHEVDAFIADECSGYAYEITEVQMTRDEFNALNEFEGF